MKNSYFFLLLLFSLPVLLLVKPVDVDAFYVESINDVGGVLAGQPYYYTADDLIKIDYTGTSVTSTYHHFTYKSTGAIAEKTQDAPSGNYWASTGFTCIGTYDFKAKGADGSVLLEMVIVIEEGDLNLPRCDSTNEPAQPKDECGTMVCECIQALQTAMESGNADIGLKLDGLADIGNQIKGEVSALHGEFQTNADYAVSPLPVGTGTTVSSMPDPSYLYDENKPTQPTTPYINDEIKFSDGGTAEIPGALPTAPDVKDWEGFSPDLAMPPELEQIKDVEKIKDGEFLSDDELVKDMFSSDNEMILDLFTPDAEMKKDASVIDAEMTRDSSVQDAQMTTEGFTQSPVMSVDELQPTESYGKTHVYEQTNVFP